MGSVEDYRTHPNFGNSILIPKSITKVYSPDGVNSIYYSPTLDSWNTTELHSLYEISSMNLIEYVKKYCITKKISSNLQWVYVGNTNDTTNELKSEYCYHPQFSYNEGRIYIYKDTTDVISRDSTNTIYKEGDVWKATTKFTPQRLTHEEYTNKYCEREHGLWIYRGNNCNNGNNGNNMPISNPVNIPIKN